MYYLHDYLSRVDLALVHGRLGVEASCQRESLDGHWEGSGHTLHLELSLASCSFLPGRGLLPDPVRGPGSMPGSAPAPVSASQSPGYTSPTGASTLVPNSHLVPTTESPGRPAATGPSPLRWLWPGSLQSAVVESGSRLQLPPLAIPIRAPYRTSCRRNQQTILVPTM